MGTQREEERQLIHSEVVVKMMAICFHSWRIKEVEAVLLQPLLIHLQAPNLIRLHQVEAWATFSAENPLLRTLILLVAQATR